MSAFSASCSPPMNASCQSSIFTPDEFGSRTPQPDVFFHSDIAEMYWRFDRSAPRSFGSIRSRLV